MKCVLFIAYLFLHYYSKVVETQKTGIPSGDTSNSNQNFLNDVKGYQDEIMSHLETLKNNEVLPNKMNQQLKELNDILVVVNETQHSQKKKLAKFSRFLEQTKLSLLKMLSEYENRIDQLEYNIMETKIYDPYIEKFKYPINKYWLKIDLSDKKSHWKFEKSKNFISIKQSNDLNNLNNPSTILLLKHHKIIDGFVSAEILQTTSASSKVNHSAAGIVFHFSNSQNYRFVELSFVNEQGIVIVGENVNGIFKRILSKNVYVSYSDFNTLTCKFENQKISIFLNYEKIIELIDSDEYVKNVIGLFTRVGKANFKNVVTGNIDFEKELEHKLQTSNVKNVSKLTLSNSFRFAVKNNIVDDLMVYEIPHEVRDYDTYDDSKRIDDVYPVPPSDSYYDDNSFKLKDVQKKKNVIESEQNVCKEYSKKVLDLNEWDNKNSQHKWKLVNEYGITRIVIQTGIKNFVSKAALVYKNSTCNSAKYSAFVKLEYNSEAGLLFRYDNKENMYIVTISTKTKNIVLSKLKNDTETIIKTEPIKNINSFQKYYLSINDEGEKGTITIFLDNKEIFSVTKEFYYKSGYIGFYIESGYAIFDTFYIEHINKTVLT